MSSTVDQWKKWSHKENRPLTLRYLFTLTRPVLLADERDHADTRWGKDFVRIDFRDVEFWDDFNETNINRAFHRVIDHETSFTNYLDKILGNLDQPTMVRMEQDIDELFLDTIGPILSHALENTRDLLVEATGSESASKVRIPYSKEASKVVLPEHRGSGKQHQKRPNFPIYLPAKSMPRMTPSKDVIYVIGDSARTRSLDPACFANSHEFEDFGKAHIGKIAMYAKGRGHVPGLHNDPRSGEHGHVWEAVINGHAYALKMFRFDDRFTPSDYWNIQFSDDDQLLYMHPFSCESRAYARLKELDKESIAVRCYGYLMLGEECQTALRQKDQLDWEEDWGHCEAFKGRPLQALVKELVEVENVGEFDRAPDANYRRIVRAIDFPDTGRKLIQNMKTLHRAGILNRDINNSNVVMGKFLEFSSAWTVPHPCLSTELIDADVGPVGQLGMCDAHRVDGLIEKWNQYHPSKEPIWDRAAPSRKYQARLRSHRHPEEGWREPWNWNRGYWIRPDKFQWEKAVQQVKHRKKKTPQPKTKRRSRKRK
ncbi:hypothetical protein SCUP234_04023 [Seiridium cupressi]